MKKYKMLKKNKAGLYQIRALIDIPLYGVEAGDLGGFIESEKNLSHNGDCWVHGNASVKNEAVVYNNALVTDHACIQESAVIEGDANIAGSAKVTDVAHVFGKALVTDYAHISGNAKIYGSAEITEHAQIAGSIVKDEAQVSGHTTVHQSSIISDTAQVFDYAVVGETRVYGDARIGLNAKIASTSDYLVISGLTRDHNSITFFRSNRKEIMVIEDEVFAGSIEKYIDSKEFLTSSERLELEAACYLAKLRILKTEFSNDKKSSLVKKFEVLSILNSFLVNQMKSSRRKFDGEEV